MSQRLGNPAELIFSGKILNSPTGARYVMPSQWLMILSIWAQLNPTATVGNRSLVLDIYDSASFTNRILRVANGATIPASAPVYLVFAPGLPNLSTPMLTNPPTYYFAFPADFCVPPNAGLLFFDSAAIDPNDALQPPNVVYSV